MKKKKPNGKMSSDNSLQNIKKNLPEKKLHMFFENCKKKKNRKRVG